MAAIAAEQPHFHHSSQPQLPITTNPTPNTTTETMPPTTATSSSTSTSPTPHLDALRRDGFVVIRSLLPAHLLLALQAASKYIVDKARAGQWPYVRTVPKQYPPWPTIDPSTADLQTLNIWGIQHLLHPDMPVRDVFASVYFHDSVLSVVEELVGVLPSSTTARTATTDTTDDTNSNSEPNRESLVMELFNLLISPSHSTSFSLRWHRDDIPSTVSPETEVSLLSSKSPSSRQLHAQYNIALFPDSSLTVIPGSHSRARTTTEREADPFEPSLPDQVTVQLEPGDAVFYNSNILHRGVYEGIEADKERGRMTLHGSVGLAGHGRERARQVLQHAVGDWVGRDTARFGMLEGRMAERAEAMRRQLIEMGSGEGLGYSLEG